MSTFIALGNPHQPFARLLKYIEENAHIFPQPIVAQVGHTPFDSEVMTCINFIEMDEFERLIKDSDLVILQAGGGSVLLAVNSGKTPVVVPRRGSLGEHIDDHQIENGTELAATGKVEYAANPEDIPQAMKVALQKQKHKNTTITAPLVGEIERLLTRYSTAAYRSRC